MNNKLIWKDDSKRYFLKQMVLGNFVNWAVRQSPYSCPNDLINGLKEFNNNFDHDENMAIDINELKVKIDNAIEKSPTVLSWNSPKKGNNDIVFCDRYQNPAADYDFIDLSALSRNITHSVWLELCYGSGWFE